MHGHFRNSNGGFSLLAAGIACLLLAGMALGVSLPGGMQVGASVVLALAGLGCLGGWWRARREARYDLSRLFDAPPPDPEEPYEDAIPHGEAASVYCAWCDEVYPPGTHRCRSCNRPLA